MGEIQQWFAPGFDDSSWTTMNVPYTWNVMSVYLDYEGQAWTGRSFPLPLDVRDAHLP